ncbi:MAG TPA: alpha/beta fold hydrolase [Phycisphaerae bacterium]|jgi:pimeloyl-ACP methyl ester carboxylesterase|nr:alpha/beta fold hydrolase [Phycisphaerae bacterium]HOJ56092.1 alpha/beta fold hydrolase [Phycisphaerae bacterium]HOL25779.1 alpha/beta fold hydrolase [Phycisphaerae bacterium]HPP19528.1 alpha/beta fold hydrolase [Phycisphaerae bacterium]HPU32642.1 alpha/beta fold hydrolase [Phycisphaerae bacterium]
MSGDPLASVWWHYITLNWALVSIVGTLTFLFVTCWLILRKYVKIMFNIIRDTPPPLAMGPRDFERIEGERVMFRAFDNLNLCGMFLSGAHGGKPKGMVVFSHEFSSDMYSCARYCRPLLEAGYDVFSFDYRGHGESSCEPGYQPRQWPTEREVNDILGAIAYVEDWLERHGRPVEIGIFGISRGAGAAILAAQNNPAVKALIVDGAFSSDTTLEYLMKRWAYIFAKVRFVYENHPPQFWRFLRWLLFCECRKKLNCTFPSVWKALRRMDKSKAILFIHGARDSYIPVEQSQMLYDLAPVKHKSLWIVPGAKHNQSVVTRPEYYASRTVAFFDEYLARPAAVEPPVATKPAAPARRPARAPALSAHSVTPADPAKR